MQETLLSKAGGRATNMAADCIPHTLYPLSSQAAPQDTPTPQAAPTPDPLPHSRAALPGHPQLTDCPSQDTPLPSSQAAPTIPKSWEAPKSTSELFSLQ